MGSYAGQSKAKVSLSFRVIHKPFFGTAIRKEQPRSAMVYMPAADNKLSGVWQGWFYGGGRWRSWLFLF